MASVLLEGKPYRPFKSSEEYLEAMKEDLAEWLNTLYPDLNINAENFMGRLDTGVILCKHANFVRKAAEEYLTKRQARNKSINRFITSGLAGPILLNLNVHYLPAAKSGTFFARDNVSNFIAWCRKSLKIFECLLFETDDLIMRKNEKHVILCLLEVARRGAKFGMLAPMLVQMERQIDREIAADFRANEIISDFQCDTSYFTQMFKYEDEMYESDSEDDENQPLMFYGPQPQIITNDLKSLDEMVRDLVEKCTCPSQFPMVRVSEGKYRIGDTKVLIFVRILRSHVMVRVGGGWDTLAHYLDKHDPCRCKTSHRVSVAARIVPRTSIQNNSIDLHKAQIFYERSPPNARKFNSGNSLIPQFSTLVSQNRSRSPTPHRKQFNQIHNSLSNGSTSVITSPKSNLNRRSMSPSPKRLIDIRKKTFENIVPIDSTSEFKEETPFTNVQNVDLCGRSIDNTSDNGSEISDEGYRSLGLQQLINQKTESQASVEEDDLNTNLTKNVRDSKSLPKEKAQITKNSKQNTALLRENNMKLTKKNPESEILKDINEFIQTGIFISDDSITINISETTGLKKTGFSNIIYGAEELSNIAEKEGYSNILEKYKISRSPQTTRRRSVDNIDKFNNLTIQDKQLAFYRISPEYRSVKLKESSSSENKSAHDKLRSINKTILYNNSSNNKTWTGRQKQKLDCALNEQPIRSSSLNSHFDKVFKKTISHCLYDSNGRRINSKSTSLTTSPVKNKSVVSPLAQQILRVANNAKSDAQMLEKMKILLQDYNKDSLNNKDHFNYKYTSEWVHNNCDLDDSESSKSISELKSFRELRRTNSNPSSNMSNPTICSTNMFIPKSRIVCNGISKIPAPIRRNTELY